jgi:hypothetical protein
MRMHMSHPSGGVDFCCNGLHSGANEDTNSGYLAGVIVYNCAELNLDHFNENVV